jgi:hypothetical protein
MGEDVQCVFICTFSKENNLFNILGGEIVSVIILGRMMMWAC